MQILNLILLYLHFVAIGLSQVNNLIVRIRKMIDFIKIKNVFTKNAIGKRQGLT